VETGLQKTGPDDVELLWRAGIGKVALLQRAEFHLVWGHKEQVLLVGLRLQSRACWFSLCIENGTLWFGWSSQGCFLSFGQPIGDRDCSIGRPSEQWVSFFVLAGEKWA
jgi:hypothetical protein